MPGAAAPASRRAIRSASPSTAVRSSRPFSKARRVNSPGSASRQPSILPKASSTPATTAWPPCSCSSATSSPVSLCGAGNHSASASSIASPLAGSRTRASAALRGSGTRPVSFSNATRALGPDNAHHRNRRRRAAGGQGENGGPIRHIVRCRPLALQRFAPCGLLATVRSCQMHQCQMHPCQRRRQDRRPIKTVSPARRARISFSTRQPGRLVALGTRSARARPSRPTSRSCSRSATRPATGAMSWRTKASRTAPPRT